MGKNNAQATAAYKKEMINALEVNFGNVTAAAKAVGIIPRTHYTWLKEDDEYADAAENMRDLSYRKVKDSLLETALKKIEKGDTAVLNKMLGIYFKNLPDDMIMSRKLNDVQTRMRIRYVKTREEAEEIMRERGQLPNS